MMPPLQVGQELIAFSASACVRHVCNICSVSNRQAVKLLQLSEANPRQASFIPVHSSLAAASAWRYSQLLTALPKRETEASNWQRYAEYEWSKVNGNSALQEALGSPQLLKGNASKGSGVVIELTLRRALPCFTGTDLH